MIFLLLASWSTCVPIWAKNPDTQKYYQVCSYYWQEDKKDVGFGMCPAFQHYHADDQKCHRDDTDAVISDPPDPKKDLNG